MVWVRLTQKVVQWQSQSPSNITLRTKWGKMSDRTIVSMCFWRNLKPEKNSLLTTINFTIPSIRKIVSCFCQIMLQLPVSCLTMADSVSNTQALSIKIIKLKGKMSLLIALMKVRVSVSSMLKISNKKRIKYSQKVTEKVSNSMKHFNFKKTEFFRRSFFFLLW